MDKWSSLNSRKRMLEKIKTSLDVANKNVNHRYRLELAAKALKAYFFILLDITGMNDSTPSSVKWNDDSFIDEVAEKGLRNIKYRARNKVVVFKIQRIFLESFRTFIKLRRFILNGHECETLFFTGYSEKSTLTENGSTGGFGMVCYDTMHRLFPLLVL